MYTFSFCEGRFVMYVPITYFVKKECAYTVKKYITSILALLHSVLNFTERFHDS